MKKINFVARNYFPDTPGGAEKVFYEIYKKAKKEFDIKIISSYINKKKFPKNNDIFKKKKIKNPILRYVYYSFNMTIKANFNKFDLIHANNIECFRLTKKPFILTIHHIGHLINPKITKPTLFTWFQKKMLIFQANNSSKIITVSKNTYNDLIKIGVKKDKITIIPNGVDLKLFKPIKNKNKIFTITLAGRISPEKGIDFAINSIKKLPKNIFKNVKLKIVGSTNDINYYNSLEKDDWIEYKTNLNEKEFVKEVAKSNLIIFPTFMEEGFGLIVIEAMSCGVPVLASDQKAIREAGGEICQYFKQGHEKEFNKNIIRLYKNKKLRDKLIKQGLKWVKKFSWNKVYEKHKKIYEELLNEN